MKKIAIVIATLLIVALLGAGAYFISANGNQNRNQTAVRVVALERQDLERSVSATGTVYSANSTEVHSTRQFPVQSVNVRVGDRVSEGDLLALLDMSTLETDMAQLRAGLASAQAATNQNHAAVRSSLEAFRRNLESGDEPMLLEARFGVSAAEMAVQAAEVDLAIASANFLSARQDFRDYRRFREWHDYDRYYDFDPTLSGLRSTMLSFEGAREMAANNLEMANQNLILAEEKYRAAQVLSADALVELENMARSAQLATDFNDLRIAIQGLEDELERAEIRAPVSGTVTAVNAEPGSLGSGLLFVLQDTDSLIVRANIREFDIASVNLGDRVNIRADATGSEVFSGTLARIAPTSILAADGSVQSGAGAEFESEVAVSPGQSGLRIGMNTRLTIVTGQARGVYAVPTSAIASNQYGENIIFIALPGQDGGYIAKSIVVTTGMETEQQIGVSGHGLEDGMLVIRNAEGIRDGLSVAPHMYG